MAVLMPLKDKNRSPLPHETGRPLEPLLLKIRFLWGSLFYLTYAVQAYQYTRRRDRLEQQFAPPLPPEAVEHPGKLLRAEATGRGAQVYFEQAELSLCFLTDDLVRLDWQPGLAPIPYAIATDETDWPTVSLHLTEDATGWRVSSATLTVEVDWRGGVRIYNAAGTVIREELPPYRQGETCGHEVILREEEHIYGLGERAAPLNLRSPKGVTPPNHTYRLWNYDAAGMYGRGSDPMYICIPVYLSLHHEGSYLVFYENSFNGFFTLKDTAKAQFDGGSLRYYISVGTPAHALERYTQLTGRSPLPPLWALGYHQSRWNYRTEDAVRETARRFQALDLPLSAIHLDIDVQVGYRAFTIDPVRFPKLADFTQELMKSGIRFITILNPGVKHSRKSRLFIQGQMLDAFCKLPNGELVTAPVWCGWSVFPDFTNAAVRRWWSRQYEFLLDLGVAGFWHDMNEPAAFISHGDRSIPTVTQHHLEGRGGDHREAHNLYGFLQAEAGYEGLRRYRPNLRPFIVSRAGWAGLQRYAWTWTGDVECTWEAMHQTIATVLGLGLSGIPYSGADIGGFQGNPTAELYLRWFQMSTFFPFFRSHCSNNAAYRTPWTYGEPYLSIMRQFLKLRYQLLPYFYTLAWEATQTGHPFCRPLFWSNPEQPSLWDVDDAFYLGDALLICPVFEEGGRSRQVILPPGHWYSFWDDALWEGDQTITMDAPLETPPVLVRAGSLLPMQEQGQVVLHLYPSLEGVSCSQLYQDAGDGYGPSRCDRFRLHHEPDGMNLLWEGEGDYPLPTIPLTIHIHQFHLHQVWVEGNELQDWGECNSTSQTSTCRIATPFQQAFLKGVRVAIPTQ